MKPYPKDLTKYALKLVEENPTKFSTSVVENLKVLEGVVDSVHYGSEKTKDALARAIALILSGDKTRLTARGSRTKTRKRAKLRTKKHL